MTGTNPFPECGFFWLGKLLKRGVTTIKTIATLVGVGFSDYGVVLAEYRTTSKDQ